MATFLNKLFTKKEIVDNEKLNLKASMSFQRAQVDKGLLHKVLGAPTTHQSYLSGLQKQLLLQERDVHPISEEVSNLTAYLETCVAVAEEPILFKFQSDLENDTLSLPVYILYPLVQNAVTWGYNTMSTHPIRIRLKVNPYYLKLEVSNRVNHHIADQQENEIISNYRARLAIHYPEKHSLVVNSNSNTFKTTLLINF